MDKNTKRNEAQGAEIANVEKMNKNVEIVSENIPRETKKQQAKSVSYALKAVKTHIETLTEAGLFSEGQKQAFDDAIKLATTLYVNKEFGI